jgi:ABC-2 type transport system permease protein
MHRIWHYLKVYREFVFTSFAEAMTYRVHFVLLVLMELFFYAISLASVDILFDHVARVGVWNREQFLFFVCFMLSVDQLHMTFVSTGFWELSEKIRTGGLDYDLLRPLNLLFTVFFRHLRPACLLVLPVSWMLLIYFGIQARLPLWGWVILPGLILLSFLTMCAVEILLATGMFLTVEGNGLNFLRMQLQEVSRWPDFIYSTGPRRFFTFLVPVLMIGSAPVKALFDPSDTLLLLWMPVLLVGLLLANKLLWRWALRGYESASS